MSDTTHPMADYQILYTRQLPGGGTVEIGLLPVRGGQQAGSPRPHCRVTRPLWSTGWRPMWTESILKARAWWELVDIEADIPVAWVETVGGVWPPPRYDEIYREGVKWLDTL